MMVTVLEEIKTIKIIVQNLQDDKCVLLTVTVNVRTSRQLICHICSHSWHVVHHTLYHSVSPDPPLQKPESFHSLVQCFSQGHRPIHGARTFTAHTAPQHLIVLLKNLHFTLPLPADPYGFSEQQTTFLSGSCSLIRKMPVYLLYNTTRLILLHIASVPSLFPEVCMKNV